MLRERTALPFLTLVLLLAPAAQAADVTEFVLIDATNDQAIAAFDPLEDGATLDLILLPTDQLNIEARVDGAVGSVVFSLTGVAGENRTENVAPYALFGDSGGDFNAWTAIPGDFRLTAQSFSQSNGAGTAGVERVIDFSIIDGPLPPDGDGSVEVFGGEAGAPTAMRRWHRVTLSLAGPGASETSSPNPFLDYRLQVELTAPDGRLFNVPGYFAGDGVGGAVGNRWLAHLAPDMVGTWLYEVSLRQGAEVAVDLADTAGAAVMPYDGTSGSFTVSESTAVAPDLKAPNRGLIKNRGHHYLTDSQGRVWLKGGPNIPENLLGYTGFDNTPSAGHDFDAHLGDWRPGDPDWNGGAGRALIGALNYIADRGANVVYFLPMNLFGDANDTFPTISGAAKTRYDLSKLAQWEIAFGHAQSRGIFLHFVLAETESGNENYHDGGDLGPERKLYYRMLNARFGHHNGLEWNLGEENDYGTAKREEFAAYLKAIDPYDHPVTTHTHGNQYEGFYAPLLGNGDFDLTSFQGNTSRRAMFDLAADWRQRSAAAGAPWMVSFDEPQKIENDVTDQAAGYPHGRRDKLWPLFLGGGGGFEWYVQQDGGGHSFDQAIDDFAALDAALTWTGHLLAFLGDLPLLQMTPDRSLVSSSASGEAYALALEGEVYALYHDRAGGPLSLDLTAVSASDTFTVRWFDPRLGGALQIGSVAEVTGGAVVDLGSAPHTAANDWACLVTRSDDLPFADGFESGDTTAWDATVGGGP
ncbi:MAG: DUF5060 domain-containing protein [Acidobacteriota bacterium]